MLSSYLVYDAEMFFVHRLRDQPLLRSYPVEILSYHMRMKGMALYIVVQNVAFTINTFVNPIALDAIGWK